jgi:transcriptional regulator with XRE-family HTH domain
MSERVRMQRLMLGLSQSALADGLGLTFQQVQKYEKGSNRLSASRLQRTAQILQVTPEFFFDGARGQSNGHDNAPALPYVAEFLATSNGIKLTRAFTRLPDAKLRRSIVALVEQIADSDGLDDRPCLYVS